MTMMKLSLLSSVANQLGVATASLVKTNLTGMAWRHEAHDTFVVAEELQQPRLGIPEPWPEISPRNDQLVIKWIKK